MMRLIEKRFALITKQNVGDFLDFNTYLGQRPLKHRHVETLVKKQRQGDFLAGLIIYAKLPDGNARMVNGQHQCHMVQKTGEPIEAVIFGYECDTEKDVWRLFSQIDAGERRNIGDVMRASRCMMDATLREIPQGLLAQLGAAIHMVGHGGPPIFQSCYATATARVEAVLEHPEDAAFMVQFRDAKHMNRLAVRMAMVATHRAGPAMARIFWDQIRHGNIWSEGDSRRRLRDTLMRWSGGSNALAIRDLYTRCLCFWNAHVAGVPVPAFNGLTSVEIPVAMKPKLPTVTVSPLPLRAHDNGQAATTNAAQ